MADDLNLPELRKRNGLTQAALAELAGVDPATVWRWEKEGIPKRGPARAFLEGLAARSEKETAA